MATSQWIVVVHRPLLVKYLAKPIEWTMSGLSGIIRGPFRAQIEALTKSRIMSTNAGGDSQYSLSRITISEFSGSDNGGTIHCINAENSIVRGMASTYIRR